MKRITATTLLAIASLAMAGTSFAQSSGVQANVPFAFTVDNQVLPAGTYRIEKTSDVVITVKNRDKAISLYALVNQAGTRSKNGGMLVFHKYGGQYFLSEVLSDSASMNVSLEPSKAEKRVRLQQAMVNPSSEVFIASR